MQARNQDQRPQNQPEQKERNLTRSYLAGASFGFRATLFCIDHRFRNFNNGFIDFGVIACAIIALSKDDRHKKAFFDALVIGAGLALIGTAVAPLITGRSP